MLKLPVYPGSTAKGTILCGDALDTLRQLPDDFVHLAITSPPYNLDKDYDRHADDLDDRDYLLWMRDVWTETLRVLVHGGRLCINIGENKRQDISNPTYSAFIQQCVDLGMLYRGTVIWYKNSAAKHCAWGSWQSCSNPHIVPRHEYILAFSKGSWKLDGARDDSDISDKEFITCTRSLWTFGTERKSRIGHPAPFPLELPRRLMKFYSYRGNVVLDMFAGSGTVGVAAVELGRRYILIDNSLAYCRLARRRIREAGGRVAIRRLDAALAAAGQSASV